MSRDNGVRLKVCGITEPREIDLLAEQSVDFAGLWYGVPDGPADLGLEDWRRLAAAAAATEHLAPVLVTFAKDVEMLREALAGSGVHWIQLHGYQTPGLVRALKRIDPELRVIKVLHVRGHDCVEEPLIASYEKAGVDVFLFDAVTEDGRVGSTGETLDVEYASSLAERLTRPFLLAGGISAENRSQHRPLASHPRFLGIDVDTNARGADGKVSSAKVEAISRAWKDQPTGSSTGPSVFTDALLASRLPVIMEVKRRTGDGVDLIGERTIPEIVAEYSAAGAPCISVVTGKWFGGDDQMLRDVVEITDLPILKKDFITRESQVVRAKEMGASAILLTARILPKSAFQSLIETILRHDLTPFVEVADHDELDSVIHAERCIVAINNKDIRNQERGGGDIELSRSLLEATIQTGTPCPVSASAITDPKVAAELIAAGFKGLLIGTGLLLSGSVQGWVDDFERHRSAREVAPA